MTRPLRILIPGAFYHVTCRGNDRRTIYRDDPDRSVFFEKLKSSLANYDVDLRAVSQATITLVKRVLMMRSFCCSTWNLQGIEG